MSNISTVVSAGPALKARPRFCLEWRFFFVVLTIAYYFLFALFPSLFQYVGVTHFWGWFLDSHAIVAASDAAAAGLDVYTVNPLDTLGRPHVYPRLWLQLSELGFTREHNFLLGGLFVAGFFTAAILWLSPRSMIEALGCFGLMASGAIVLGVERANNDLFVFTLLMSVIPLISSNRQWVRWLALIPILAATALKFYPAVAALILVAGGGRREILGRAALAGMLLATFFYLERADLITVSGVVPAPRGLISFGADQLFPASGVASPIKVGIVALIILGATLLCRPWRWFGGWNPSEVCPRNWNGFVLGATVLIGCFFAGSSFVYRLVFCIMLAPFLWHVVRDTSAPLSIIRLGWVTTICMFFMLWSDMTLLAVIMCYSAQGQPDWAMDVILLFLDVKNFVVLGFFTSLSFFMSRYIFEVCALICHGARKDCAENHKVILT